MERKEASRESERPDEPTNEWRKEEGRDQKGRRKATDAGRWGGMKEEKDSEEGRRVTGGIKVHRGRQANGRRKAEEFGGKASGGRKEGKRPGKKGRDERKKVEA